jgi:FKBP-type peptidyl-prolyl cis-trans isomerase SlyD
MKSRNLMLFAAVLGFAAALMFSVVSSQAAESAKKGKALVVSEGKSVKVEYTLTVDGKVIDSSKGRQPLEFTAGSHQVVPGFEKAVMGMKVGEKKSFKVKPEEGYGAENPKAIRDIPRKELPADVTPKAGMTLYAQAKNGQHFPVKIVEVKKDVVVMDFNHPLAGKTLNFDVQVIDIK